MSEIIKGLTDEIGPEAIYLWHNPDLKLNGVIVIDTTAYGTASGGTRMLPDITVTEIAQLARAMTYKFAALDFPVGGAKCGIWADPNIRGPDREAIFRAYGRAIRPLLDSRLLLSTGTDMGTSEEDIRVAMEGAGRLVMGKPPSINGEPLDFHATGYGVVVAAEEACRFAGITLKGASVAVEGFGKVGGGVVKYMTQQGATVVAISTVNGCVYNPDGLDAGKLFKLREEWGDGCVLKYLNAMTLPKEELFYLPVNLLVPGARPRAITRENVNEVKAKVISSGANAPITDEAEEILFQRGVTSVPDFISNSGGVLSGAILMVGGGAEQVLPVIKRVVGNATVEVLGASAKERVNPRRLAVARARERVLRARAGGRRLTLLELQKVIRHRVGL